MTKPLHLHHLNEYKVRLNDQDSQDLAHLSELTGIAPAVISRNAVKEMLNRAKKNGDLSSDKTNLCIVQHQELGRRG